MINKRKIFCLQLFLMILFTSFIIAQKVEFIDKTEFADKTLGGECIIKSSKLSVDGKISMKTFEIEVPYEGEYYLSAWVMNTGIVEKNNGLKIYIDGEKNPVGKIKPLKESWQCAKLLDNNGTKTEKLKLTSGTHSLTFCSIIPEIPNVEFIRLSKNESDAEIPESQWDAFIEEAKKNILPPGYFELKNNSLNDLKLFRIIPNPEGDYLHDINGYFTYSYAATYYFDASTNVILETKRADPCASDPVMYLFNSSDPVNGGSWSDDDGGDCSQSKITCTIQNSGIYWVFVRSKSSNGSQTTNLYLNNSLYASNIAVSGAVYDCDYTPTQVINYFTIQFSVSGDPKLWIESYDGKILAYNDDYSGSGDFTWQQNARVKKLFNQRLGKCLLTSSSTYYSTGYCDLYMRSKNSTIMDLFENLKADDAIMSAPGAYYNCIGWSGGMTDWVWPPWDSPWSDYSTPALTAFDNFYGNKNYSGQSYPRYNGAWNYTRSGATSSNNQVDLWSISGDYTHGSVKAKWTDLSLGNPANDNPHGYDWESKPGGLMRTFHPRYALSGYRYGNVDKYYRSDGTKAYSGLLLAKNDKDMSLEESIAQGFSTIEVVEFSQSEKIKLVNLIERVPEQVKQEFDTKYSAWKQTWNDPKIAIHSNPRKYAESKQYEELLDCCKKYGKTVWPLLFSNFEKGTYLDFIPIRDLSYSEYRSLLDELNVQYSKPSYTEKGVYIVPTPRTFQMRYIQKLLALPDNTWGQNFEPLKGELNKYSSANPEEFSLEQNYPNPFNPITQIRFGLPSDSRISIKIYDIVGREIAVVINDEVKSAGWHIATWDSRDYNGNSVSSGVYFCRLVAGTKVQVIKLILMK